MFWSTPVLKAVTLFLMIIFFIVGIFFFCCLSELTLRIRPTQRDQVEIVGKRTAKNFATDYSLKEAKIPKGIVTFKFSDGTEKELEVTFATYESMQEGDTGRILYQERKNATKWQQRYFITFE